MVEAKRYVRVKVSYSDSELAELRAAAKTAGKTVARLIWERSLRKDSPRQLFLDLPPLTGPSDSDSTS